MAPSFSTFNSGIAAPTPQANGTVFDDFLLSLPECAPPHTHALITRCVTFSPHEPRELRIVPQNYFEASKMRTVKNPLVVPLFPLMFHEAAFF